MIYTVTLNPSIDYIVRLNAFTIGAVNRAKKETAVPGGKGINVSVMLARLGVENTALGFLAGFTGEEIRKEVRARGVREDFSILSDGFSRINVKLKAGEETEINGNGPEISQKALDDLMQKLSSLRDRDILVLSGSVPNSVLHTVYRDIMQSLLEKDVKIVVDAAGSLLLDVLPCRPFLIKPNHHELSALFNTPIETRAEVVFYAKKLKALGAQNVLVSMAEKGAILLAADGEIYEATAPQGKVLNSVGAGDSMVAGFLAGYLDGENYEKALKLGVASGSASAFSEDLAQADAVFSLYEKINQKTIE